MRENGIVRKLAFPLLTFLAVSATIVPAQTPPTTPAQTTEPPKPPPVSLGEFSQSLEGLVSRVRPAVVQIFSTGYATADDSDSSNTAALLSTQRSTGSGI